MPPCIRLDCLLYRSNTSLLLQRCSHSTASASATTLNSSTILRAPFRPPDLLGPPPHPTASRRRNALGFSSLSVALSDALRFEQRFSALRNDPTSGQRKSLLLKRLIGQPHSNAGTRSKLCPTLGKRGTKKTTVKLSSVLAIYTRIVTQSGNRFSAGIKADTRERGGFYLPAHVRTALEAKGYKEDDVHRWHSILTVLDDVAASTMIYKAAAGMQLGGSKCKPVPHFVLVLLLRRKNLQVTSLQTLCKHAWEQWERQHEAAQDQQHPTDLRPSVEKSSLLAVVIRLMDHARRIWPEACPSMAHLFIELTKSCWPQSPQKRSRRRRSQAVHPTRTFNKILSMLSLPSKVSPFHSVAMQQKAQFDVLRRMAEYNPPILINRKGYKAVASVQLANIKTDQERDWDSLKAKTWPPWKQDKTGLDAEKDPKYGTSRVSEVLRHARNAGYGTSLQDQVAEIFAGWDADGSPTIQTRTLGPRYVPKASACSHAKTLGAKFIWAARIKATRTVQEAWACFLTYEENSQIGHEEVYLAMHDKLAAEEKQKNQQSHRASDQDPHLRTPKGLVRPLSSGDSLETFPLPSDPKDQTYLKTPVPTLQEFVHQMYELGFYNPSTSLPSIIKSARSLKEGLRYAEWGLKKDSRLVALYHPTPENEQNMQDLPNSTFTCFVSMLCRFSIGPFEFFNAERSDLGPEATRLRTLFKTEQPVLFAHRLLQTRRPWYRPPWLALLNGLADRSFLPNMGPASTSLESNRIVRWRMMQQVRKEMEELRLGVDGQMFLLMCRGLERTVFSSLHVLEGREPTRIEIRSFPSAYGSEFDQRFQERLKGTAERVAGPQSFDYIRSLFHTLFGTSTMGSSQPPLGVNGKSILPRLLARPYPAYLHAYVRVTGVLRHWDGLLELVRWMAEYEREIADAIQMPRNGPSMLRRTIVAVRVFCERSWRSREGDPNEKLGASEEMLKEVREIVEACEGVWGGWPDEEEVDAYVCGGPFPRE